MQPKVSVLICAYNAEKYIQATLQSVLDQSYTDMEVLVLDNNSKDKTVEVIKANKDVRIHLFQSKKNLGPYGGLNFLLPKATGEYIAIQDHDDLWYPEKLAKQITFLQRHQELVGCGTTTKMLSVFNNSYFDYVFPRLWWYVIHPSLVFRNRPGLAYNPKEAYMGDAYFMKHILCEWHKRLWSIDEVLTTHIIQGDYSNTSFSWFKVNTSCIRRLFAVHGWTWYTFLALGFELMRKLMYPSLKKYKKFGTMLRLEQLPFRLLGFKIKK